MKVDKYNLFEAADIKKTKGLPKEYLDEIDRIAEETYGTSGPSMQDKMNVGRLMHTMFGSQIGNEDKLTEIGKKIIMDEYGDILDGVKLDIKIVPPHDKEKREMFQKIKSDEKNLKDVEAQKDNTELENEVHKRKILNNLLQGEAQNIQNLMFYAKDKIDKINPNLLNAYVEFFKINKKEDWKKGQNLRAAIEQQPDFANMVDTYYEDGEDGEDVPVIKVRALDLPMLLHETIKGVYDLIMAHAIPDDIDLASKIKKETHSIENEQEDVKYGPYIAADIRDYILGYVDRKFSTKTDIKNLREFIYARLSMLKADIFVDLIEFILLKEANKADFIMNKYKVVEDALKDIEGEDDEDYQDSYSGGGNYLEKDDEFDETGYADNDEPEEVQSWKIPKTNVVSGPEEHYNNIKKLKAEELYKYLKTKMTPSDREKLIDYGLDEGDYDVVRIVSEFIKDNGR